MSFNLKFVTMLVHQNFNSSQFCHAKELTTLTKHYPSLSLCLNMNQGHILLSSSSGDKSLTKLCPVCLRLFLPDWLYKFCPVTWPQAVLCWLQVLRKESWHVNTMYLTTNWTFEEAFETKLMNKRCNFGCVAGLGAYWDRLSKQISFGTKQKVQLQQKNTNTLCGSDGWSYLKVKNIGSLNRDVVA